MDLRSLPPDFEAPARIRERRMRIEGTLGVDLKNLAVQDNQIGSADEKNCEQMFGAAAIPVGLAGPLLIRFGKREPREIYLPLGTTEGALVASINRGCKALTLAGGVHVSSDYRGITRSIAFEVSNGEKTKQEIIMRHADWKKVGEETSRHLKMMSFDIDLKDDVLFLTIAADTDEAMGMNMLTIAAQAIAQHLAQELNIRTLTVASNVESDKKPSTRTKTRGRGYYVDAAAFIPEEVIREVLKTDSESLIKTAYAKLELGSDIAGALGHNLQIANTVAALYLATGQDVAHVVEASLGDTKVSKEVGGVRISVTLPAVLVGVRGGGVDLPAQRQCLDLLLRSKTTLRPAAQLAETIAGAVLAGELSLLAAQTTQTLAHAHRSLGRAPM